MEVGSFSRGWTMGLDRTVRFPIGIVPAWDGIRDRLLQIGRPVTLRMIDGVPAFPDETPGPGWRELRLGTAAGMVTLRSVASALTCVIWGNADSALLREWDAVCWACAAAGAGVVETPTGSFGADDFALEANLRPE